MKGDKLGRQGGSGSQKRNHEGRQAWETRRQRQSKTRNHEGRQAWETSWQRQPRAKSRRETSLEDKAAEAAKSEIMKGDKLHRQGGSGNQKRHHEGRQIAQTRRQRQPRAKLRRETSLEDKATAAAKSEIMKGDKLGKQGGSGSGNQFPQSGTHPLRSKNPYSFAIWGTKHLWQFNQGAC